jgi:hypothetical protein
MAAINLVATMESCTTRAPSPEEQVYSPPPSTVPRGPSSSDAPMGVDLEPDDPDDWGPN